MLERLRSEMEKRNKVHEELVKKYDAKIEDKKKVEVEMLQIEKEIIHNQGAMQAINDLGVELMDQDAAKEQVFPTADAQVEVIEN